MLLGSLLFALALAPSAHASSPQVLVLGRDGKVAVQSDPFLLPEQPPGFSAPRAVAHAAVAPGRVLRVLRRLRNAHAISTAAYRQYVHSFKAAERALGRLGGTRAAELGAVIANLNQIAASGLLTRSRLGVLFLTLDRNREWWTTGRLLATYQRVSFAASQLIWEYYPGQGLELQELGSWGQVHWMYRAGPKLWPRFLRLVNELIPLAAHRGGGLAWEYYFHFDGGAPPWTSAMSQGTAVQALTEAYKATHDSSYLDLARRSLPIFSDPPPVGVSVHTARGRRYLLYSFDPARADEVINGFIQTLIGLFDYASVSGDPHGWKLFNAGDAEARAELPSYDTGAWSLYQPGQEASLSYHQLVTQFLQQLCMRTHTAIYCSTAARFEADLKTPPALQLLTHRLSAGQAGSLSFRLSKISRVGITLVRGGHTVFATSAQFPYRVHAFAIPALRRGSYTVRLDATDLAGNYGQIQGSLTVA
jgi:hypothetical protein